MTYATRVNNVYLIDTKMFGFDQFNSAYLVVGDRVALVDTGTPTSWQALLAGLASHGFSPQDLDHIFVTHAEHPDHSGNVGALLAQNQRALVHVSPLGTEYLVNPAIEADNRARNLAPAMAARFGDMEPVPPSRLSLVQEGEVIDLGNGVNLRVILSPGHQPSGFVLYEEKHKGLFINDLCGAYFPDAGASWIFTPYRSDVRQAMNSLRKLENLPLQHLFLGHYGISDRPAEVLTQALARMQALLDLGAQCVQEGKEDELESRVLATLAPEVEKMGKVRERGLYLYLKDELTPSLARAFAKYYLATQGE